MQLLVSFAHRSVVMLSVAGALLACGEDESPVKNLYVDCSDTNTAAASVVHQGPSGTVLRAPVTWKADAEVLQDAYGLGAAYRDNDFAHVLANGGMSGTDEADAKRMIEDLIVRGGANVRRFEIDGHPAVASASKFTPNGPGCAGCPAYQGPELVGIAVGITKDRKVVTLSGVAPAHASKRTLCELQETLASVRW